MCKIKTNIIYPFFIPHEGCPFRCIFCDQNKITTQPITSVLRKIFSKPARSLAFNRKKKIISFIKKHSDNYKEIAFYGGTFTLLKKKKMQEYFNTIKPFIDDKTFFRISTRPDAISEDILWFLKKNRVNTIELGIQSFSDKELYTSKRRYNSQIAQKGCYLVKSFGFNLAVQLMVGLPSANEETYFLSMKILKEIQPQFVRLYPLVILKDTILEKMYLLKKYQPLSIEQAAKICVLFLEVCNQNSINLLKIGIHSDISKASIAAGPFYENFGELVYGLQFAESIKYKLDNIDELIVSEKTFSQLCAYNKYPMSILLNRKKDLKIIIRKN